MDYKRKKSFENAFKKAVINFDETKIWFEHPSRMYLESKICFVLDRKLVKFPMYKSDYHINKWKYHFINYLETGKFDKNAYWELYPNEHIAKEDIGKIFKFPLTEKSHNKFYEHSKELNDFLYEYRKKYPKCGIQLTDKDWTSINF